MLATPCHILIEGNPIVIYASRNGTPERLLPILQPFLETFWQERELVGEHGDTPACLAAQVIVRLGFEFCEDDFSNLKASTSFDPAVEYLYEIKRDRTLHIWVAEAAYRQQPQLGLAGCRELVEQPAP
ncbi:MAG: hypothetical protein Fur0046_22130 [Cyanobacteria bacterium J069]|nr:MAG: histidine kinase [Cyanobacteria bacterium J069]